MQNTGFNASHSLCYAFDSLYGAYLKGNYPLEYYTIVFNNYEGDFERTDKLTSELSYFNIHLSPPKFRYSSNNYTMDKQTNTIFKGVSSIKGISKTVGGQLSNLKDKQYNSFFEFLQDLKINSIHQSDVIILTKLNYFSEFGKIKTLLRYIEIFQQFYGAKTFNKNKEYLIKTNIIAKFCEKETEKQYSGFNDIEFLNYVWDKLPQEDITTDEKIKYELEYYGYIDTIDNTADSRKWCVTSIELKGNNYLCQLHNVFSGKQEQCKIRSYIYKNNIVNKGDFILFRGFSKEGKRYLDENGKWQQSTEIFENILKEYRKI